MLGAEFGGDDEEDLLFEDADTESELDGNKSTSGMPGAVRWIRSKTKKATKKLLTKTPGGNETSYVEGEEQLSSIAQSSHN